MSNVDTRMYFATKTCLLLKSLRNYNVILFHKQTEKKITKNNLFKYLIKFVFYYNLYTNIN